VRPIAVGDTLRRLVAKWLLATWRRPTLSAFAPALINSFGMVAGAGVMGVLLVAAAVAGAAVLSRGLNNIIIFFWSRMISF